MFEWYFSCRNICWAKWEKPKTFLCENCRSNRDSLWRRYLRLRTLLARWVPNGTTKGPVQDKNLSPQYRQVGKNLSRYLEKQVVSGTVNQICAPLHPGLDVPAKLRRSSWLRNRWFLERKPGWRNLEGKRVDSPVC